MTRSLKTLPNGARIVMDPMPSVATAAVGVWIGAGARHEPAKLNGLAHFLEHMAFKGAGGRDARQIAERVEARGAVMNAATDYERTGYFVRCLKADAADMLSVALDLALDADLPEGEMERERNVVLQEIGEAADQPDDLVFELAQTKAYPDHALGRPILGERATLNAVTRDDLAGFVRSNYQAPRVVVSVAGAFDANEIEDLASVRLSVLGSDAGEKETPPAFGAGVATRARDLEQTHLVLSRPAPSALSEGRFAARAFAEIFGGGMASRLFQEVRETRGLAYAVDAYYETYSDAGRLNVYAGCAPEDAEDVVGLTSDIWADLAANGPSDQELERAKATLAAQFAMAAEAPAARAGSAAYEALTHGRLVSLEETLSRIDDISVSDVTQAAANALSGGAVAASVGPKLGLDAAGRFAT
ncbi:MAG: pitrilysin family protein [Pseudomonadota bacterium]